MISSTQRQVAALAAASVLAAFLLHFFFVLFAMRSLGEAGEHFPERTSLRIVARLYAANPDLRRSLLQQAASEGMVLREIPDFVVRECTRSPPGAACPPGRLPPFMKRATESMWLAIESLPPPPPGAGPRGRLITLICLVALPTLALSLWASRRITAPLRRLTEQAERVDPETHALPLKVEGTTEIRLLAEAFNRLIARLTHHAADQRRTLAAISHDLRTPLTRLRLRAETVPDTALRGKLVRDAETMQGLIDRALALLQAADSQVAHRKVDLSALVQTVADDMQDAGVKVAAGRITRVDAVTDARLLTGAIENLLQNAANYAGGGTLSLYEMPGEAVIEVADRGPGLSEAERGMVFAPWYRGDAARGGNGHGLGLSIVQTVMRSLGGRVELSAAQPHGLVARLFVPLG